MFEIEIVWKVLLTACWYPQKPRLKLIVFNSIIIPACYILCMPGRSLGSRSRSTSPRWYQLDINLYFITFNVVKHFLHCLDVGSCDEYKIRICLLQSQSTLTIIKSPQCRKWGGEQTDHSVSIGVGERNSKPVSEMWYTMKAGLMM